ncbi:VOC family protein [Rivibacter subsaxonicus]|uniref:Putative 3-demethylubiquinone-9 3-methyltransferase (Glyoxalase superfamily) n=1 Tax=Rivibacter subsaxonicus TaxID=457575 RepID=A0A4Q7VZL0_9BURK|nr:VOC family protein [Rivibacter subsaxonicus]RZU02321.1 putative 3-demethylubiquinone-9 3-methyltransferase (glyoxalase superfamily) [Rivibacter subsaxonicus]
MQKITPFLWFDGKAEEAMDFYVSIFANACVLEVLRYGEGAPAPAGSVMTARFVLDGQEFVALNGGPMFQFSPAISFVVNCDSQREVDRYWDALCAGGVPNRCGWLQDRYGVSWQVVPTVLPKLLNDPEPARAQRAMAAMMQMTKLDIAELARAHQGK